MRQPNPLDPFDDVKRWLAELWPIERVAVYLGLAGLVWVLIAWAVH